MTKFICIGGKARSGKDTTAAILKSKLVASGKKVLLTHYADLLKFMCKNYFEWNGEKDEAGRTLLQQVGTEEVRSKSPDFWVDFIVDVAKLFPDKWDYIIISDTRFPNEIYRISDNGYDVTFVKILRPDFVSPLTDEQQHHKSETALDSIGADYVVVNGGTIEDLNKKITSLCEDMLHQQDHQPEQMTIFDGA